MDCDMLSQGTFVAYWYLICAITFQCAILKIVNFPAEIEKNVYGLSLFLSWVVAYADAIFTLGRQLFAMQYAAFSTNVCGEAWLFALP